MVRNGKFMISERHRRVDGTRCRRIVSYLQEEVLG